MESVGTKNDNLPWKSSNLSTQTFLEHQLNVLKIHDYMPPDLSSL